MLKYNFFLVYNDSGDCLNNPQYNISVQWRQKSYELDHYCYSVIYTRLYSLVNKVNVNMYGYIYGNFISQLII